MDFRKKLSVFINLSFLLLACSCSYVELSPVSSVKGQADFSNANLSNIKVVKAEQSFVPHAENTIVYIADVGNGHKTTASISIKINYGKLGKLKFSTLAPKTVAVDLAGGSLKFFLLEAPTGSNPTGDLTPIKVNTFPFSHSTTITASGQSETLTFSNVSPNTTVAKSYFIAVAAFNNGGTNITNASGTLFDTFPSQKYYLSTTGGDTITGGGINIGSVHIDNSYILSGNGATNSLGVALQLASF